MTAYDSKANKLYYLDTYLEAPNLYRYDIKTQKTAKIMTLEQMCLKLFGNTDQVTNIKHNGKQEQVCVRDNIKITEQCNFPCPVIFQFEY